MRETVDSAAPAQLGRAANGVALSGHSPEMARVRAQDTLAEELLRTMPSMIEESQHTERAAIRVPGHGQQR